MKRAAAWAALLALALAWTVAMAQIKLPGGDNGGGGVAGGGSNAGVAITLTTPRCTQVYSFEGGPILTATGTSASSGGWKKTASSGLSEIAGLAPVIMSAKTPRLQIEMQGSGAYQRVQEAMALSFGINGQHRSDEYRVSFDFSSNAAEAMTGDKGVLQIVFGDSSYIKFNKKPKGFGLIFIGSDHDNVGGFTTMPSNWVKDKWIGFVGSGTDTTYIPLKAENLSGRDFWYIYAAPGGGPVMFYCNGALLGTISDVTRDTGIDDQGFSVEAEGGDDGQPEVAIGPLAIERNW